jgi:NAD(P)-dependent dehydrogenase (short-subunit alcohol dehydrogenase family)
MGVRAIPIAVDVAEPDQVHAAIATVAEALGPIDVLVNSASMFATDTFPTDDLSVWRSLLALTRQLAVELAPTVRCNAVALGPTIPPERFDDTQVERLRRRTLLGRWAGGAAAGGAVRYLAEADAVTGACLTVDGGEQYGHVRDRFQDGQ